jgi:hypothetical protein
MTSGITVAVVENVINIFSNGATTAIAMVEEETIVAANSRNVTN